MKKYFSGIILLNWFLIGCSSPPPPPSLNSSNKIVSVYNELPHTKVNQLSKNTDFLKIFKNTTINYEVVGFPFPESEKIEAIFLATHSDKITIIGNEKMINSYSWYLKLNGINKNIITENTLDYNNNRVKFIFSGQVEEKGRK